MPIAEELRRTNFIHFAGPGISGRIFPETDPVHAYFLEPNPEVKNIAHTWVRTVKLICGVKRLNEVSAIFGDTARTKGISPEEREQKKKEIGDRCIEAFAQRHRITISDMATSNNDYGITLSNTRKNQFGEPEIDTMTKFEVAELMTDSIRYGRTVRDYLQNPHSGVLRGLSNVLPAVVNEPLCITKFEDLLLLMFSPKWGEQTRFEARQILGLSDLAAEVLLYKRKYEGLKDKISDILDHHGVFNPSEHGPLKDPYNFLTLHNPETFYVEGVKPLQPGEKYEPQPNLLFNSLRVRTAVDEHGEYLLQLNDEPKGIVQTMLKMIRRNTLDPAEIRDNYRMAATFVNRADIERFLTGIKEASKKAGKPIVIDELEFENTLEGDKYEAVTNGKSEIYAGSSKKYQVMRRKLYFADRPDLFWELSCYTLEAFVNYNVADNTGILEYLVRRLIEHNPENVDAGVFEYLVPQDIYGIDAAEYLRSLVHGIRTSVREKEFVHNEHMTRRLRLMSEGEIAQAVNQISEQIQPHSSTIIPDYQKWPDIIIAIGKNTMTASQALARRFKAEMLFYPGNGHTIADFLQKNAQALAGRRVLFLDDVGINANTVRTMSTYLQEIGNPPSNIAFLALEQDSTASAMNPYYGSLFTKGEYIFFPSQLHEYIEHTQSVFGICYRYREGQLEVLLQEEDKEGVIKIKLPGGTWKGGPLQDTTLGDESTLETLRRETDEELGSTMRRRLSERLDERFPVSQNILLDPDGPDVTSNTLHLLAYFINGHDLEIDDWQAPENSNVESLKWVAVDEAIDKVFRKGYRNLLRTAKEILSPSTS